jgi:hypothetical protein
MAPLGHTDLLVPARGSMAQAYSASGVAVRLRPPKARASQLGELDAFAIHAIEEAPPHGTEPLEWMLLSSVPTTSLDEVLERLAWYARRWTTESWHRVLKSGCRIEARQFGNLERFVRATALFAVISWRICTRPCWRESTPICLVKYCCNPSNGKHCIAVRTIPGTRQRSPHSCSKRCCGSPCSADT